jgi:hypothetical protein
VRTLRFALLFALLGACTSAQTTEDFDLSGMMQKPDGGRCAPGQTQPCICLGGGMGTQTCRASGASYGSCAGCGPEEEDGPLPVIQDGGNPCGDCDGCCDGATCVPFANQSNMKCGTRGQACGSCGTKICDTGSGMCVDASGGCNASSCANGCCKQVNGTPTCFINQPAACGTGGGTCTACTYGVLCNGGCTTMLDGNAQFKVVVTKASFYNTDVDTTSCWDNYASFGCAQPDVIVCFGYQSGTNLVEGCTTSKDNVPVTRMNPDIDDVTWSEADGTIKSGGQPFLVPGSLFIQGGKVRVRVYDIDDFNDWEVIGSAYINAQSNYAAAYNLSAFGRVTSITFSLK